jgi:membrane protein YqaA with SNARE-associated domain
VEAYLMAFGYPGLFAASFLAATLVPLGSEAAVVALSAAGLDRMGVLSVATAGNVMGSVVNYGLGRWGGQWLLARFSSGEKERVERASRAASRWGAPLLFFAWLPVVGDPLTVAAGLLRVHPLPFLFWVTLGKALRYWLILEGIRMLP